MAITDSVGAGSLTSFVVVAAGSAYAQFDDINMGSASGSVGDLSLTRAASGYVSLHDVIAKSIGNVTIAGAGSSTIDALEASTIGNIDIQGGNGVTLTKIGSATGTLGDISVSSTVSGVTITGVNASTIGAVTLGSQSGTISITMSGTNIGTVDASGMSAAATLTIDLSNITNGTTILAGRGTNNIRSTNGDDTITLTAGTGTDTITFVGTAHGNDTITGFSFASGIANADKIQFGSAITIQDFVSATTNVSGGNALTVALVSSTTTADLTTASQVIIMRSGTYGTLSDLMSAISTGGSLGLSIDETTVSSQEVVVVWSDSVDSYVTLITLSTAVASGGGDFIQSSDSTQIIATLAGVNIAAVSADQLQGHFLQL